MRYAPLWCVHFSTRAPCRAKRLSLLATVARVVGYSGGIIYDSSKPDGTPRKLMDVGLLKRAGWQASTGLEEGLRTAYAEFQQSQAAG